MVDELVQGFDAGEFCELLNEKFAGTFSPVTEPIPVDKDFPWENAEQLGIVKTLPGTNDVNMPLLVVAAELPEGEQLRERSSRVKQFKFARKVLDTAMSNPSPGVDGLISQGLFVFHDDQGNFRLSLVYGKPEGTKLVWSAVRRLSFYVEAGDGNKTFRDRVELPWATFDKLKDAFSVEKLTKEFYSRLFKWYQWALSDEMGVTYPNDTATDEDDRQISEHIIRLITRLMFVWFLKQKHLVPDVLFDPGKLKHILKKFDPVAGDNYYRAILQNLFFATLNSQIGERKFAAGSGKERREHFDIKTLYRYPKEFAISEGEVLDLFKGIPFLNGGLFECLDKKQNYLDGFSRSPKCAAKVPNRLFFDPNEGLVPLLQQYNFTVEENSPGDEEVALDPELLGKVFENLLAAYNPETNVQARKATGSFYTPREIVNYMVDESLIAHLKARCGDQHEESIRQLFAEGERPEDAKLRKAMDEALVTAKILDPACGSGAFPMGMLLRMVDMLRILRGIAEDDPVYDLKLELIENCIYGADIQCIAVQISKLRFFISLVCEQKPTDDSEANYGIHSLPNLETKFVAANSLIGLPHAGEMLPMQDVEALKKQLWSIRHRHFLARSYQEKKELRKEDRKLRTELAKALELGGGFDTASAKLMAEWDPYDQNTSASFLDAEWMFNVAAGFDVVIGNPPYGRIFSKAHEVVFSERWPAFRATKDAYVAFMLQGLDSTRKGGVECFIVPSAWLGGPGYELLRSDFLNRTVSQIISLPFDMFAAAYVDNAIILVLNSRRQEGHVSQAYAYPKKAALDGFTPGPWENIEQAEWGCISGNKIVLSSSGLALQKKLQANCQRTLRDVIEMRRGVLFNKSILREHRTGPRSFQYFDGDVYRYALNTKMGGWVTFGKGMKECPKSDKWFRGKRLLLRRLVNRRQRLMATLADADFITNKNLYSLLSRDGCPSPECLLAVVNSALMSRLYIDAVSQAAKDDFPQVTITDFLSLPLPTEIAPTDQSKLADLADSMLAAKKADASADVTALEAEIDRLVYKLYDLTPEEIAVVEGSVGGGKTPDAGRPTARGRAGRGKKAGEQEPKPSSSETTPRQRKTRKRKADLPPSLPGWD